MLVGTRLYVHQIIGTLRDSGNNVDEVADYLGIRPQQVNATVAYYADFADEVDEDAAAARHAEEEERTRWERQRQVLT